MTDEQLYKQLKSEVVSLYSAEMVDWTCHNWYEKISYMLRKYFNIQYTHFYFASNDRLVSLQEADESDCFTSDSYLSKESAREKIQTLMANREDCCDDCLLFYDEKAYVLGAIVLQSTEKWRRFKKTTSHEELHAMFLHVGIFMKKVNSLKEKERNYRQLYRVTEQFNSTMQSKKVLDIVMETMTKRFPNLKIDLLLSHEQKEKVSSYRLFDYLNERQLTIEAFLSGEVTIDKEYDHQYVITNIPIKGKQGIYGILQIRSPHTFEYSSLDREFIQMIAQSAGNALENASLYDQSAHLIEDLQLVNETSKRLNDNLDLSDMMSFLKEQLLKAFNPTEYAFVFFKEGHLHILKESSPYFASEQGERYLYEIGQRIVATNDALFDSGFDIDSSKVPEFQSLIASPIINRGQVQGFIILLHREKYAFSFEDFKLACSLVSHASLAVSNILLREQLQQLVDKDSLTKLYSRRYADKVIAQSLQYDSSGVLLVMDIDNFKMVNDTYGHTVGDRVLVQVAETVKEIIGEAGIASRWGGEEITVLLPCITLEEGLQYVNRLLQTIPLRTEPSVTVSIGITSWTEPSQYTYKQLFIYTDEALYEAKETGKDKYVIYRPLQQR